MQAIGESIKEQAIIRNFAMRLIQQTPDYQGVLENVRAVNDFSSPTIHLLVKKLIDIEEHRLGAMNREKKTLAEGKRYNKLYDKLQSTKTFVGSVNDIISNIKDETVDDVILRRTTRLVKTLLSLENYGDFVFDHIVEFKVVELINALNEVGLYEQAKVLRELGEINGNYTDTITVLLDLAAVNGYSDEIVNPLRVVKNEMESQIDIILRQYTSTPSYDIMSTKMLYKGKQDIVYPVIQLLRDEADLTLLSNIIGVDSIKISHSDLFKLKVAYPEFVLSKIDDDVYVATKDADIQLITSDVNGELVLHYLLKNGGMTALLDNTLKGYSRNIELEKRRIEFKPKSIIDMDLLTEGFKVTEDGGIKLTYKKHSTYMDDYASINRTMVMNARNKSYDALKSDLVFMFQFINELETKLNGKEKITETEKEDALRARAFAKGDFKQFLLVVQKESDPSFDFSSYYEKHKRDNSKVIVEFSNKEIQGIKKLLRTIVG